MSELENWDGRYSHQPGTQAAPRSLDAQLGTTGAIRRGRRVKYAPKEISTAQPSLSRTNLLNVMDGIKTMTVPTQANGVAPSMSAGSFSRLRSRTRPPVVSPGGISSLQGSSREADMHLNHPIDSPRKGANLAPHTIPAGGVIDITDENTDREDETEEMCIDAILRPSQMSPPPSPPKEPPRFAPPSSPYESLFTPPTSSRSLPRLRKNLRLSHVAIPPFPAGLSKRDYRPVRLSSLIEKDKRLPVRVHASIEDALKAALQHNARTSYVKPEHRQSRATGSLKRKRSHQGSRNAGEETIIKKSKVQAKTVDLPTESSVSAPLHDTHTPGLQDQAHSFLRLLFDVVDPVDPPPSSYAALVSSMRHLQPEDYKPPDDELGFAQVKPLPVFNGSRFIFPPRELSPSSGDEISLNDGFYAEDDSVVPQTNFEVQTVSAGPSRSQIASSSPSTKRIRTEYNSLPLDFQTSAKGLGKGKAIESVSLSPHFRPPLSPAGQSIDLGLMAADLDTDLGHYFNDLSHDTAAAAAVPLPASQTAFEGDLTVIAPGCGPVPEEISTFHPEDPPDLSMSFISTDTPIGPHIGFQHVKGSSSLSPLAKDNNIDHLLTVPGLDEEEVPPCEDTLTNPWFLNHDDDGHHTLSSEDGGGDSCGGYVGNGTIDPSLLSGGVVVAEPQAPSPSPSLSRSPSPSVVIKKPSQGVLNTVASSPDEIQYQSTSLTHTRVASKRVLRAPVKADMVITDQLDLSSEWDSEEEQISSMSDDSDFGPAHPKKRHVLSELSDERPHPRARRLETKTAPKPSKRASLPVPIGTSFTCCHHCRSTTWREKMTCSGIKANGDPCGKRFCQYCIEKRYPDITFILNNPSFICPWCDNTCGCTQCTRKRGEVYIGYRGNSSRHIKVGGTRDTDRRGAGAPGKRRAGSEKPTAVPLPLDPAIIAKATKFWGTIYGLTGERVGKAFVGDDGDDRMVVARPTRTSIATRPRNRKRRVFVGKAQEWWGIKRVRDLEPSPPYKGKGKRKAADPSTVRFYIGKRSRLHAPLASVNHYSRPPSPALSTGNSTSTLSTDNEWPGSVADTGEESRLTKLEGLPPGFISLGEDDVERAIAAALSSLL